MGETQVVGSEQYAQLISKIKMAKNINATLKRLVAQKKPSSVLFLHDKYFSKTVHSMKSSLKIKTYSIGLEGAESTKSFDCYIRVLNAISKYNIDRDSILVSIGGGAISDLSGFIAGTYLRGLSWINVPTTLLSMVDAGYGGKTGINYNKLKNCIGMFYAPEQVWINKKFLMTLSQREILSGFGEVLKYGLLFDKKLFSNFSPAFIHETLKQPQSLEPVILKSLSYKAQIVKKDPREKKGIREWLNLGHTFAHALESSQNDLQHGEAVLVGLYFTAEMSFYKKLLSSSELSMIYEKLNLLPFPKFKAWDKRKLWKLTLKDKKNKNQKVRMVGLKKIGSPVAGMTITQIEFDKVLTILANKFEISIGR